MENSSVLSKYKKRYDKGTPKGKLNLKKSLKEQSLLHNLGNNKACIKKVMKYIKIETYRHGTEIHYEDEPGKNYLYLILKGRCRGLKNNNTVTILSAGEFFGEFPILNHSNDYGITAEADGDSCFGKISEVDLENLAKKYPKIWFNMARVLVARLREQNEKTYQRPLNKVPKLFIASSKEAIRTARALKVLLESENLRPRVWSNAFETLGESYLERLEAISEEYDYGVFVFNDDDDLVSKEEKMQSTRDNVIFELGLFVGKHNRRKAFILWPENKNVKLPSDFEGIILAEYNAQTKKNGPSLKARLKPACKKIKRSIHEINKAQKQL
ncbi:MAG: TIR domain-containing protein [Bacteroidota bacterium]